MKKLLILGALLLSNSVNAQSRLSDEESRFYQNKIANQTTVVKLSGKNNSNDSKTLNALMVKVSNKGGGVIRIPAGTYYLKDIVLQSNIHLQVEKNVVFMPVPAKQRADKPNKGTAILFNIGKNNPVENIAITSVIDDTEPKNWFTVKFPEKQYLGGRFIVIGDAKNFKISGVKIDDSFSKFSSIVMNMADVNKPENVAHHGVIQNVIQKNAHVGYGLVQVQAGKNLLFKNLDGAGGVTLRVETGAIGEFNKMTVDDIVARNITVRHGDAAFNMSPHRIDQGRVDAQGIYAYNSSHAVQIAKGFLDRKKGKVNNIGYFDENSFIGDIHATGGFGAQIKGKDLGAFDCEERNKIIASCPKVDKESQTGRSIAVIRDNASLASGCKGGKENGCYNVKIGKVTKHNSDFALSTNINFYKARVVKQCPKVSKPNALQCQH